MHAERARRERLRNCEMKDGLARLDPIRISGADIDMFLRSLTDAANDGNLPGYHPHTLQGSPNQCGVVESGPCATVDMTHYCCGCTLAHRQPHK